MPLNIINPIPSQCMMVTFNKVSFEIWLDSGASVSFVTQSLVDRLNLKLKPNGQLALLADAKTRIRSKGEVDFNPTIKNVNVRLRALVVDTLPVDCYGGTTFHVDNNILADISKGTISIHNNLLQIKQFNVTHMKAHPPEILPANQKIDSVNLCTLPSANIGETINICHSQSVLPGDLVTLPLKKTYDNGSKLAIVPQFRGKNTPSDWLPQICQVDNNKAIYSNPSSGNPLYHPKNVHFAAIPAEQTTIDAQIEKRLPTETCFVSSNSTEYLNDFQGLDNSVLNPSQVNRLKQIHLKYAQVFDSNLTHGFERYEAKLNFNNEQNPPPHKLWAPQFNRKCQSLLQAKCDQLQNMGVIADPIEHGISVRNVSPCFIMPKGRAKHKKLENCSLEELRFITCFNSLNDSIRPIPSKSNTKDDILKFLSRQKYIIHADLFNSYFQIRVAKQQWKHLGILTPFKGLRVLTRLGQGLLNSDVELDQVVSHVLGEEISTDKCLNARDDLFVGGQTVEEALNNWEIVTSKFAKNNLKIAPHKVKFFPQDTVVFGDRVQHGKISPSDHVLNTLGKTKIEDLITVKQVNSWKGLFKTLIRHLPDLASLMVPFDKATAGIPSISKFDWTQNDGRLINSFNKAMSSIDRVNSTYLPRPSEQLILLPDASTHHNCVGWALYVEREDKLLPVQYCSAKLPEYMSKWLPCELEGVGVVVALEQVKHWVNESHLTTLVMPDSKPVVEATKRMKMGKFSKSPRLQSLLSCVNRYNVRFQHNSAKKWKAPNSRPQ